MAEDDDTEESGGARTAGPVSKRQRLFKLAGMTASVASNYAKERIGGVFRSAENAARARVAAHQNSGEVIARTLGELKGAAMKVGQMASVAQDVLPKELADALTRLQKEAPPMPYGVIASQVEKELGAPVETLFHKFDRKPFAAASIGQVHRAITDDGREVVVKVQYPGVDESVDSDMAHLKLALRASGLVKMPQRAMDAVFREIRARLREELDYCNEADNVRAFREAHRNDAGIVIPDVVGERSAQRVLTLTYEAGDPLSAVDERYTQETRDRIATNLFALLTRQLFETRMLHADPNPGNFAYRPDGTIVVYDFGCVKRLSEDFIETYRKTIVAGLLEDWEGLDAGLIALGVRVPSMPSPGREFYKPFVDLFATPLRREPFDYRHSTIHDDIVRLVPGVLAKMEYFQPPAELVFVDRTIAGHYGTLRRIGARGWFVDTIIHYLEIPEDEAKRLFVRAARSR